MPRLITFGDSFTYGHGLADCHIPARKRTFFRTQGYDLEGPIPSKLAWPQLLGDMLGFEVINKSKCGSSNIWILKEILTFENFLPTDIVVIGWTFSTRDCIFNKNIFGVESETRVSPWTNSNNKIIKNYFNAHNDHDLAVRTGLYIHHADAYLKNVGVQQYHFDALHHGWYNTDKIPVFIKKPDHYISSRIINHTADVALDDSHPGPIAHQQAAKKLYEIINAPK